MKANVTNVVLIAMHVEWYWVVLEVWNIIFKFMPVSDRSNLKILQSGSSIQINPVKIKRFKLDILSDEIKI